MFYNVENLFDTFDDTLTRDEEFLPKGDRYWSNRRFNDKLRRIFQVVMAVGEGNHPAIIGLCEVENRYVLEMLLERTPLGRMGYKIVHKESPDRRGIDVALLYHEKQFTPIQYNAITVTNPDDNEFATRDILYVKGTMKNSTVHYFVNHWPSKYGGTIETIPLRALAAKTLKTNIDSIFQMEKKAKIIILGDFNDDPFEESITRHLGAVSNFDTITDTIIYNLSNKSAAEGLGTIKYRGKWELIDQVFVSGSMLKGEGIITCENCFRIFESPFLMEKDEAYLGMKPFRTYIGFRYNDGFSDHLPVYIDLTYIEN
jgi:predicted extracellular nuclease